MYLYRRQLHILLFKGYVGIAFQHQALVLTAIIGGFVLTTAVAAFGEVTHFFQLSTAIMQVNRNTKRRERVDANQKTQQIFLVQFDENKFTNKYFLCKGDDQWQIGGLSAEWALRRFGYSNIN